MATIKFEITVPDDKKNEILNDFVVYLGYKEILDDGKPNPQTKAEFGKTRVAEWVKNCVKSYRAIKAADEAREQKEKEVEAIQIT